MDPVTDLIISISNPDKTVDSKLKKTCYHTMRAIPSANRISLWTFNQQLTQIECVKCLTQADNIYTSGAVLTKQDHPEYFEAILSQQVLVAADARHHAATECFNQSYFAPNNIYSLLDYVLVKDMQPIGVICCESVDKISLWSDTDIATLHRIANITSIFFERN